MRRVGGVLAEVAGTGDGGISLWGGAADFGVDVGWFVHPAKAAAVNTAISTAVCRDLDMGT